MGKRRGVQGSENRKRICRGLPQDREECVRTSGHDSKYSQPRDVGCDGFCCHCYFCFVVGFNSDFSPLVLTPFTLCQTHVNDVTVVASVAVYPVFASFHCFGLFVIPRNLFFFFFESVDKI